MWNRAQEETPDQLVSAPRDVERLRELYTRWELNKLRRPGLAACSA